MLLAGCGSAPKGGTAISSERAASAPQATPSSSAAELVDPTRLQVFLPEVSGWTRSEPESGRLTSPIPLSQTSVVYQKGVARIDVRIIDGGGNQRLFAPFGSLLTGAETGSRDGLVRAVAVDGYPAWEKWDAGTRNGETGVAVERRFLVQLEGRNVGSIDVLRGLLDATDIAGLAAVR